MKPNLVQKYLSYLFPISIRKFSSDLNSSLTLYYYRNQWMLATPEAIYSNGIYYSPFKIPFSKLNKELHQVKNVLILGAGLGSAITILNHSLGLSPNATLVDVDEVIIAIGKQLLNSTSQVKWVCQSADLFVEETQDSFDLIGIDIFKDLFVPNQFIQFEFLKHCKQKLSQKGIVIMNYVKHNETDFALLEKNLNTTFSQVECINNKQNHFFICKNY